MRVERLRAPGSDLQDDLQRARRSFFLDGKDPGDLVPAVIARSWRRCADVPLPERGPQPDPMSGAELRGRREAQARLRRNARAELESLAESLATIDAIVLLADTQGLILDAAGSGSFMTKAQRVALMPGIVWSESDRGTNAIGTALIEAAPITVRGAQHYVAEHRILGCTAVPLRAPDQRLIGVLDVSAEPRHIHTQTIGMLRMAAQWVEHRWALDVPDPGIEVLRFARDPALLGTHREALLWVRDGVIVGANADALRELGCGWTPMQGGLLDERFQRIPAVGGAVGILRPRDAAERTEFVAEWTRAPAARGRARMAVSARGVVDVVPTAGAQIADDELVPDPQRDRLLAHAARVVDAGMAVLIEGETGTGKELFARALHARSRRRRGPLVAVNCAGLPEGLIEAELFGYEAGAFTGARKGGQAGRIREADGGTLFLDEIGDMPLPLQARLLRVLQDRRVQPLGGRAQAVDFALVCATHRPLAALVAEGRFRADLYYRLQHFLVALPALRTDPERDRRIDAWITRMLQVEGIHLHPAARDALLRHDWPGNWRQLTTTLRTACAIVGPGGTITREDLPADVRADRADGADGADRAGAVSPPAAEASAPRPTPAADGITDLRSVADAAIAAALASCNGNVSRAARTLGLHRSTLHRHLARGGSSRIP